MRASGGDRRRDGRFAGHGDEVRAHHTAGGRRVVAEQALDLALLGKRHQVEHREASLLLDLQQQVGGVVARHAREHSCNLAVRALVEELELVLVVQFLEHVRLKLLVLSNGLQDLFALLMARGLDEVGDLRRVQRGDPPVGQAQARRRHVPDERLELGPWDEPRVRALLAAQAVR